MSRKIVKYYNEELGKWVRLNEGPPGEKGEKGDKGNDGTVTFSNLTSKQKASLRGASFEYNWEGTKLGVKNSDETEYTYTDLASQLNTEQEFEELKTVNKKLIQCINELYDIIVANSKKISKLEYTIESINNKINNSDNLIEVITEGENDE